MTFTEKSAIITSSTNQYNNMTTDQKTTVFALASQILAAAKATENEKFVVHTAFTFGHSLTCDKELYYFGVSPVKKGEDGMIIHNEEGIEEPYDTEECPNISICCSEIYEENCFEKMMEELKKAAAKLGIIC